MSNCISLSGNYSTAYHNHVYSLVSGQVNVRKRCSLKKLSFSTDLRLNLRFQLIDTSDERVVTKVLKCLVDLLCVHGAKVFCADDVTQDDSNVGKKKRPSYDTLDDDG